MENIYFINIITKKRPFFRKYRQVRHTRKAFEPPYIHPMKQMISFVPLDCFYIPRRGMYVPAHGIYVPRRGMYVSARGI